MWVGTHIHACAESIQVLEGLEAVRRRPGMYIGSTDMRGLHHLVCEVVDNSIDEAMAGHATPDRRDASSRTAASSNVDNGRGVPVGKQKQTGKDALEVVHTVLHAGGKFGGGGYKVSGGLHGVGVSVVNALSEWLRVEVGARRQGLGARSTSAASRRGPVKRARAGQRPARHARPLQAGRAGLRDDRLQLRHHRPAPPRVGLPQQGRLDPLVDERDDAAAEKIFYFEGGLVSFVRHLNKGKDVLHARPIYVERRDGPPQIEVAIQYNDSFTETVLAFANNINTVDGGTHVTGFRAALTRSLNDWARRQGDPQGLDAQPLRRRRPRGPDGGHQRQADGAAVRGPDQGQARQRRGQGPGRRRPWPRASASTSRRTRATAGASSRSR